MGRHLSTIGSAKPSASRNAVRAAAASDKKMEVMLGTSATSDTVTCLRFSRASAELANNLRGGILCEQIASSCRLANLAVTASSSSSPANFLRNRLACLPVLGVGVRPDLRRANTLE